MYALWYAYFGYKSSNVNLGDLHLPFLSPAPGGASAGTEVGGSGGGASGPGGSPPAKPARVAPPPQPAQPQPKPQPAAPAPSPVPQPAPQPAPKPTPTPTRVVSEPQDIPGRSPPRKGVSTVDFISRERYEAASEDSSFVNKSAEYSQRKGPSGESFFTEGEFVEGAELPKQIQADEKSPRSLSKDEIREISEPLRSRSEDRVKRLPKNDGYIDPFDNANDITAGRKNVDGSDKFGDINVNKKQSDRVLPKDYTDQNIVSVLADRKLDEVENKSELELLDTSQGVNIGDSMRAEIDENSLYRMNAIGSENGMKDGSVLPERILNEKDLSQPDPTDDIMRIKNRISEVKLDKVEHSEVEKQPYDYGTREEKTLFARSIDKETPPLFRDDFDPDTLKEIVDNIISDSLAAVQGQRIAELARKTASSGELVRQKKDIAGSKASSRASVQTNGEAGRAGSKGSSVRSVEYKALTQRYIGKKISSGESVAGSIESKVSSRDSAHSKGIEKLAGAEKITSSEKLPQQLKAEKTAVRRASSKDSVQPKEVEEFRRKVSSGESVQQKEIAGSERVLELRSKIGSGESVQQKEITGIEGKVSSVESVQQKEIAGSKEVSELRSKISSRESVQQKEITEIEEKSELRLKVSSVESVQRKELAGSKGVSALRSKISSKESVQQKESAASSRVSEYRSKVSSRESVQPTDIYGSKGASDFRRKVSSGELVQPKEIAGSKRPSDLRRKLSSGESTEQKESVESKEISMFRSKISSGESVQKMEIAGRKGASDFRRKSSPGESISKKGSIGTKASSRLSVNSKEESRLTGSKISSREQVQDKERSEATESTASNVDSTRQWSKVVESKINSVRGSQITESKISPDESAHAQIRAEIVDNEIKSEKSVQSEKEISGEDICFYDSARTHEKTEISVENGSSELLHRVKSSYLGLKEVKTSKDKLHPEVEISESELSATESGLERAWVSSELSGKFAVEAASGQSRAEAAAEEARSSLIDMDEKKLVRAAQEAEAAALVSIEAARTAGQISTLSLTIAQEQSKVKETESYGSRHSHGVQEAAACAMGSALAAAHDSQMAQDYARQARDAVDVLSLFRSTSAKPAAVAAIGVVRFLQDTLRLAREASVSKEMAERSAKMFSTCIVSGKSGEMASTEAARAADRAISAAAEARASYEKALQEKCRALKLSFKNDCLAPVERLAWTSSRQARRASEAAERDARIAKRFVSLACRKTVLPKEATSSKAADEDCQATNPDTGVDVTFKADQKSKPSAATESVTSGRMYHFQTANRATKTEETNDPKMPVKRERFQGRANRRSVQEAASSSRKPMCVAMSRYSSSAEVVWGDTESKPRVDDQDTE